MEADYSTRARLTHRYIVYGEPEQDHQIHHLPWSNEDIYYCPIADGHYLPELNVVKCIACKGDLLPCKNHPIS